MYCPIAILANNMSEVSLSIPQSANINSLPIFPTMWFVLCNVYHVTNKLSDTLNFDCL